MSSYSSPLFIFSHEARTRILHTLLDNPLTQTEITKKIELSGSEASRHLSKLMEAGFIEKKDRRYEITEYGKTSIDLFKPLKFLFDHGSYFSKHPISLLPYPFQANLHILAKADFVEGQGFVMVKFNELFEKAEHEILTMTDQPFPFGKERVKVHFILTPDFLQLDVNPALEMKLTEVDFRFYQRLPIALCIVDKKRGSIHFPDTSGRIDFSYGFFSDNPKVVDFLVELWDYMFDHGLTIDRLQEQMKQNS